MKQRIQFKTKQTKTEVFCLLSIKTGLYKTDKHYDPYSQKWNNFIPGICLTSQTWFSVFCKLFLKVKNVEYCEEEKFKGEDICLFHIYFPRYHELKFRRKKK